MNSNQRMLSAVAFIVITLFALRQKRKLSAPTTVIYLCVLIYMLFFIRRPYVNPRYALAPFRALVKIFVWDNQGLHIQKWAYQGIVLNILLFVPFGYLLPLLMGKIDRWWKVMLFGFCFSLFIEILQLVTRRGMFDTDDLINNTIGAIIGWGCYKFFLCGVENNER